MNPGMSRAVVIVFYIFSAKSNVTYFVSLDVYRPTIISTSFIVGTGFIKCIPMTYYALWGIYPAIFVIEMEEVFVANIQWGGVCFAKSSNNRAFNTKSSLAAYLKKV